MILILMFAALAAVAAEKPIYMTGAELSPSQGLFLAMPTSNFPEQTVGPLTVKVQAPWSGGWGAGGPVQITEPDRPFRVGVWLINRGAAPLAGNVRVRVIDGWRAEPLEPLAFEIRPGGWKRHEFQVSFGPGAFNAHYPVHVIAEFEHEGRRLTAHPVLILRLNLNQQPRARLPLEWKPYPAPARGTLALWRLPVRRDRMTASNAHPFAVPPLRPVFEATPPVEYGARADRGEPKEAIRFLLGELPPSRRQRIERATVEYPLTLPVTRPLRCDFLTAVSDSLAASGARFQVRVVPFEAGSSVEGSVVWEGRVRSTKWEKVEADLSSFAGRSIRIVFDAEAAETGEVYWGEPSIVAAEIPRDVPFPPSSRNFRTLGTAAGYEVRVWPGARGIFDTVIGFAKGSEQLMFRGFRVQVNGDPLHEARSASELVETREEPGESRHRLRQRFRSWAGEFDLLSELWLEGGALMARFRLENAPVPRPWVDVHIESVAAGPWSDRVLKVYSSNNVASEPQALSVVLSNTSFAGFDFANGVSVVQALDVPPGLLEVDSAARIATLNSPHNQTMAILPGSSVWDGVKRWRGLSGLRAAAGVATLAGRFTFDLWHGRYGETKRALERAFRYGMTDSVVVFHNWQHWAYDYRLPDVYPPNPQLGTFEEFRDLARLCRDNKVLFAPHDNYIDFYPDADGFSYSKVAFTASGEPQRAWYNAAMSAQSYRAVPELIRPLVERNLRLIREAFRPNSYFIDVWGMRGGFDYWTIDGKYRDRSVSRDAIRNTYAWVREYLGDSAPQITEGGTDQYIGYADGGQAQHGLWNVAAAAVERIPWFDVAFHDRFVMLGVGYHERYPGGKDPEKHGVYSDDYMSTEVLTGHPAMVIEPFSQNAVRNYWLLHDVMRALALQRIDTVEFAGGDIRRQKVHWENGGEVWVNRGEADWLVEGRTLPEYSYYARIPLDQGNVEVAVEKRAGGRVEWARSLESLYVNPRGRREDFGAIETSEACRLSRDGDFVRITSLPDSPAFRVKLRWKRLPWQLAEPRQAVALREDGRVLSTTGLRREGDGLVLDYQAGVFAYQLR